MRDALVFNGASNLDFQDIRSNVIRIPEVVMRIRQAQAIWDKSAAKPLDLATFIGAEDSAFLSHIRLRSFATAVVQVGLLDRYLKTHELPEFVVGASNGDSALKVAVGVTSFEEMVLASINGSNVAARPVKSASGSGVSMADLPVLAGIQLVEHSVYQKSPQGGFSVVQLESRDVERMIVDLIESHDVGRLIMVGPGHSIFGRRLLDLTARDVQILESIELDPMLTWFWRNLREDRFQVAN